MSQNWIAEASEKLGVQLRAKGQEACGICPRCTEKGEKCHDRLIAFPEGNVWCRQCDGKWRWSDKPATDEEKAATKIKQMEIKQAAYTAMHKCTDWHTYNQAALNDGEKMFCLYEHGLSEDSVIKWGLGYCERTPCDFEGRPSITFPMFYKQRLYDIRHRILGTGSDKYRSHVAGLTPIYWNLDALRVNQQVLVVEGEKKAIIMDQFGFTNTIAYPGKTYLKYLPPLIRRDGIKGQEFVFIYDPDTLTNIMEIVSILKADAELNKRGNTYTIVDCIDKPDDFLLDFGADRMQAMIRYRRRV